MSETEHTFEMVREGAKALGLKTNIYPMYSGIAITTHKGYEKRFTDVNIAKGFLVGYSSAMDDYGG